MERSVFDNNGNLLYTKAKKLDKKKSRFKTDFKIDYFE